MWWCLYLSFKGVLVKVILRYNDKISVSICVVGIGFFLQQWSYPCLNTADVVRKRAADIPLLKSPVFLLFLQVSEVFFSFWNSVIRMSVEGWLHSKKFVVSKQALKVDADGCKKVIEARKDKASSVKCTYMQYINYSYYSPANISRWDIVS